MNIIWIGIIVFSFISFIVSGDANSLSVITSSGREAVDFALGLTGVYALWMGFIEIATNSGLLKSMSIRITPLIDKLFKNSNEKAREYLSLNLTANIFGLTNASTPSAISAIKELDKDNKTNKATFAMSMLFVINATGIDFFPATVIALRSNYGSNSPADILLPFIIVNTINALIGIVLVYIFCREKKTKEQVMKVEVSKSKKIRSEL